MYDSQLHSLPTPELLRRLRLLDSSPDAAFDRFTRLAARMLDAPTAMINLPDGERLLFKSCFGVPEAWAVRREGDLSPSFCQHVLALNVPFVVADARNDPLVCGYPMVQKGEVISYIGVPLKTDDDQPLGVLCVIDTAPRDWSEEQIAILTDLAISVMTEIELRAAHTALGETERFSRSIIDSLSPRIAVLDQGGTIVAVNHAWREAARCYGVGEDGVGVGVNYLRVCERATGPDSTEGPLFAQGIREVLAGRRAEFMLEYPCHEPDAHHWFIGRVTPFLVNAACGVVVAHEEITARCLAEQALRESETHYRLLFEHNPLPMWVYDLQTLAFLSVNVAACHQYGYTRDEFLQMTIKDIRPPEDVAGLLDNIAHTPLEGLESAGIWTHCRKDGSQLAVEIRSHSIAFEGRRARLVMAIDVTERQRAEQALRASESKYRMLVNQASDGILIADEHGYYCEANSQACAMLGYSSDELVTMRTGELVVHQSPRAAGEQWPDLSDGRTFLYEAMVRRKDGQIIPIEANVKRLPDGRLQAIVRDVSERKRTEAELNETNAHLTLLTHQLGRSRDLLRTLFDGLDDGLVLIERDGTILTTNQAFSALVGRSVTTLVGHSWQDLCRADDNPFPGDSALQALRDGRTRQRREHYTRPDGRHCVLDLRVLPLISSIGPVDQLIVHVVDSTERLALEALAIQSERLAANGKLAATIAHELNTPLQSITSCLYFAGSAAEPQRDKYLTVAREELARIAGIVRQMLNLHRPDPGEPAMFNLNGLVERVLLLTGSTLAERGIDAICELAPVLPDLYGRADQMTQVLLNLILNAAEAMPEGGRLVIRTQPYGAPARALALEVEDCGLGIPPEVQPRIFEPFFTTKATGSGLGLSISRKIIAQHGGTVCLRSAPGVGSVFRIELPLAELMDEVGS
ncbi:MAG TPA: PAS domain S-box protein [Roseiflexaceae bacterium]|nr:PAS domain S-box protein [Roseiflexaceae bacterium]